MASLGWPRVDAGPEKADRHRVDLVLPVSDWTTIAGNIDQVGFGFFAAIAAYLVDARLVAIVNGNASLHQRIAYFDAVLALLPYGARNCLHASTWAPYHASHHAQLSFSDDGRPDQVSITSNDVVQPDLRTARARDYFRALTHAHRENSTVDIVQHLLRSTAPLAGVEEISLAQLDELRLPTIVLDEVRRGTATTARVERVLDERPDRQDVRPELLRDLARKTIAAPEGERSHARKVLARQWRLDASDAVGKLFREHADRGEAINPGWLELSRTSAKGNPKSSAAFVSAALGPPEVAADSAARAPLVALVIDYLSSARRGKDALLPILAAQRYVALSTVEMLSGGAKVPGRFGPHATLLRLLKKEERHWLRPVLVVAKGKPDRIDDRDLHDLVALGVPAVATLFRVAVRTLPADQAIEVCWTVLNRHYLGRYTADAIALAWVLLGIPGLGPVLTEISKAHIDFLALVTGDAPRHLRVDDEPSPEYRTTLSQAASRVDGDHRTAMGRVLAEYLANCFQPATLRVVTALSAAVHGLEHGILDRFAAMLNNGEIGRIRAFALPPEWHRALIGRPDLLWYRQLTTLDELVRSATIDEIVGSVTAIAQHTHLADEVVPPLVEFARRHHESEVDLMLEKLFARNETTQVIVTRVRDAILNGHCGSEVSTRMATYIDNRRNWYTWLGAR
ncbi:hypothetical protein [Kutzneria sp. NPDC052558]|uniref:hypothetical protein n=1 Tax=Kutzneria sp. NPDC052558 TaxID=3364121 RepID=UPI0037C74E97